MKTIKGRYDGSVVVLDEPAPVTHEADVEVMFPEPERSDEGFVVLRSGKRFRWDRPRPVTDTWPGSVSDEVIRQRREED